MAQTKRVSVLASVHDCRLKEPMVRDKSVMRRLNGQSGGECANRLSSDSAKLNMTLYFHASKCKRSRWWDLTRGDDLRPTHDGYNTITNYRCPDEIMWMASQSSQMGETGLIVLKSFEVEWFWRHHRASSSSFKVDQYWGLIKLVQDIGSQPSFQDRPIRARLFKQDIIRTSLIKAV